MPIIHLPVECGSEDDACASVVMPDSRPAWEDAARQVFGLVAEFRRPARIHLFVDSVVRPLESLRYLYERTAEAGSIMYRIILALEGLGATIHAVEHWETLADHLAALHNRDRVFCELYQRMRDEDVTMGVIREVPDGHAALVMMGAAHDTERLIRERGPDFQVVRIGTMDLLYQNFRTAQERIDAEID